MSTALERGRARLDCLDFWQFVPLLDNGRLWDLNSMEFEFQMVNSKLSENCLLMEMVMLREIEHLLYERNDGLKRGNVDVV